MPHGPEEEEEENSYDGLSPGEELAREFESRQKEYFDSVDAQFLRQNKARGDVAFASWEERFIIFLTQRTPTLVPIYQKTVNKHGRSTYLGETVHGNWKRIKGDAIEAFITQAIEDARAGRLATEESGQPIPITTSAALADTFATNSLGKVFIGHGSSNAWKDLREFIRDRLGLEWDEFNRISAAGYATKERLEEMLEHASFAFVVMTAEDEDPTGKLHARENVIHEAGLFQGRLGFPRAILLVEEGCEEFSNIHGLTQIRFPKGYIKAAFEEIRRVLEREGLLKAA